MFKKWWILLLQGVLLFIAGLYILENPEEVLAGTSLLLGCMVLIAGLAGLAGWLLEPNSRDNFSLIWSLCSALIGFAMFLNLLTAMKIVSIIYGLWVLLTGIHILGFGWRVKKDVVLGWLLVVAGVLSAIFGLMMILNMGTAAIGVATIFGIQVIAWGICFILFAFIKEVITNRIKSKLNSFLKKG